MPVADGGRKFGARFDTRPAEELLIEVLQKAALQLVLRAQRHVGDHKACAKGVEQSQPTKTIQRRRWCHRLLLETGRASAGHKIGFVCQARLGKQKPALEGGQDRDGHLYRAKVSARHG